MASTTSQQQYAGAAEEGLLERLRGLAGSLTGYGRARLELAGIEGKEAFALYLKMLLWGVAGALIAFVGYLLLCVGAVALIAQATGFYWGWGVVALALIHLIVAGLCIWIVRKKSATPVFSATMQEFRRDEQWLKTHR